MYRLFIPYVSALFLLFWNSAFFFLRNDTSLFDIKTIEAQPGKVTLRAANGKLVTSRKLGAMTASAAVEEPGKEDMFSLEIVNRPNSVLKTDYGMVGSRNGKLECNLSIYEAFNLKINEATGAYVFTSLF